MKFNLKSKLALFSGAAMIALSSVPAAAQTAVVVVEKHPYNQSTCQAVRVDWKYAYLKQKPNLDSPTLRVAPQGEMLNLVKNQNGLGYHNSGWWLVSSANDNRYWVHESVTDCADAAVEPKVTTTQIDTDDNDLASCDTVRVNWKYAYLKDQPRLSSHTYRLAPRGELLDIVRNGNLAYSQNGWWLVSSAMDRRYWVHESVVACSVD